MSEHYYQFDHHKKRRRAVRRVKWFVIGLLLAAAIIIVILFFTTSLFVERAVEPPTSGVQTRVQSPSIKVHRTKYFQFQTGEAWAEDAKESKDNIFIYRAYQGPLIQQDLTIYVNPTQPQLEGTRVQPVKPKSDGTLDVVDGISDHCDADLPKSQTNVAQVVTFKDVTFTCDADDTIFEVLIGQVNGTPLMQLTRPDGSKAKYLIVYHDWAANPTGRELRDIVRSFQTR